MSEVDVATGYVVGFCPHCGAAWNASRAKRGGLSEQVGLWQALNAGYTVRCSVCFKGTTKETLAGRGKKPFVRQSQLRLMSGDEVAFVYYGPSKGLKQELKGRKVEWPDGFRGDGLALAQKLGLEVDELAEKVGMSVDELEEADFSVGL